MLTAHCDDNQVPHTTVKGGDCVVSIAQHHGLFWQTVWSHPENAQLRGKRQDPNVLMPGDRLFVPDKEPRTESVGTDSTHRFRRKGTPAKLRLKLLADPPVSDEKVEADLAPGTFTEPEARSPTPVVLANQSYVLYVDGVEIAKGMSDGDGFIEQLIPADGRDATLLVEPDTEQQRTIELNLGHMDPSAEASGASKRLRNLGYDVATDIDRETPQLQLAMKQFQIDQGLPVTGKLDDTTRQKLEDCHGG